MKLVFHLSLKSLGNGYKTKTLLYFVGQKNTYYFKLGFKEISKLFRSSPVDLSTIVADFIKGKNITLVESSVLEFLRNLIAANLNQNLLGAFLYTGFGDFREDLTKFKKIASDSLFLLLKTDKSKSTFPFSAVLLFPNNKELKKLARAKYIVKTSWVNYGVAAIPEEYTSNILLKLQNFEEDLEIFEKRDFIIVKPTNFSSAVSLSTFYTTLVAIDKLIYDFAPAIGLTSDFILENVWWDDFFFLFGRSILFATNFLTSRVKKLERAERKKVREAFLNSKKLSHLILGLLTAI